MLFSQKNKGFFVELNDHGVMLARTSAPSAPFAIEEMRECPPGDAAALKEAIAQIQPKKNPSGYLHATVGFYPPKRIVRRHALELKRLKEPGYFAEVCSQQFRIEMPGVKVTRDIGTDARIRIEMRRDFFNAMVENGAKVADWREAFTYGQAKATGVEQYLRLIENVVEKAEERQRMRRARSH